ncbi:hypothetical protein ABIE69_001625 [Rhodobacteraceae bacterium MBR-64]
MVALNQTRILTAQENAMTLHLGKNTHPAPAMRAPVKEMNPTD